MCEFSVYLNNELVAKDILHLTDKSGFVVMKDVLSKETTIDRAKIANINMDEHKVELVKL